MTRLYFVLTPMLFALSSLAHGQDFLSEEEILEKIVGHTHQGIYAGDGVSKIKEYYAPPKNGKLKGSVRGVWQGVDRYTGRWSIKEGMFCLFFPDGEGNGCWRIVIKDNSALWYPKGEDKHDGFPTKILD